MSSFNGKVVAITGAASGIGLATTKPLYARGAIIAACDFNPESLEKLQKTLSQLPAQQDQTFSTRLVDVTKADDVNTWTKDIITTYGKLDYSVNVAGTSEPRSLLADKTDKDFSMAFEVNVRGVFNCMRAHLPYLSSGSSIVNISSVASLNPPPYLSLYSASKSAVNGLTGAAAKEYGAKGIRINAVCPGIIETPLVSRGFDENADTIIKASPLGRMGQPEEVASCVLFLLSNESSFITGTMIRTDGGILSLTH